MVAVAVAVAVMVVVALCETEGQAPSDLGARACSWFSPACIDCSVATNVRVSCSVCAPLGPACAARDDKATVCCLH